LQQLIVINPCDNVATSSRDLDKGDVYVVEVGNERVNIQLTSDIKFGHKVAVKAIDKGAPVLKYGEQIGVASQNIALGDHVHTYNVASQRGRGDLAR
jgi:altronate dehydratase small subunit